MFGNHRSGQTARVTELELEMELQALRQRRQPKGIVAWIRGLRPFDRRAIREPDDRDVYWVNVQRRLAESDAAFLLRYEPYGDGLPILDRP